MGQPKDFWGNLGKNGCCFYATAGSVYATAVQLIGVCDTKDFQYTLNILGLSERYIFRQKYAF
jgi:hypothetical protein